MDGSIRIPEKTTKARKAKKKGAKKAEYKPRTPLGKWLMKIRKQAIAEGMATLTVDEVLEEVKRRRGGSPYDEY